ncbi:hypothetical protein NEOKW01_0236 [Nematocida sp. AWRm80]|nr:hypothetical protein NEOKW01_0236 [Nematocida sp. AWRm80]
MDIVTRENNLVSVNILSAAANTVREHIVFYKNTKEYRAISTSSYLQVECKDRIVRIHLFRGLSDVHVINDIVYLIGDNWIESICKRTNALINEIDLKKGITSTAVFKEILMVLSGNDLIVLDKSLKTVSKSKLEIKLPNIIYILESEGLISISSSLEKSIYIFSTSGQLVKRIETLSIPKTHILMSDPSGAVLLVYSSKTQIVIVSIKTDTPAKVLETDHIHDISQIIYHSQDNCIYSCSKEGVLCCSRLDSIEAEAVYVDCTGIRSIHESLFNHTYNTVTEDISSISESVKQTSTTESITDENITNTTTNK